MILPTLPLARTAVDADAVSRTSPGLFDDLAADPSTGVLLVHRGLLGVDGAGLATVAPSRLPVGAWDPERLAYLGRDAQHRYVALVLPEHLGAERDLDGVPIDTDADLVALTQTVDFEQLRDIGDRLEDRDAGLATTAVALAAWHERHPRCARCGAATEIIDAGWVRRCRVEGTLHYPRTDPAVIMAVTDSHDRILLGHAAHWPAGRFSTLAGYVEPGESLEEAVRREVAEETGIVVDSLRYRGSQPWPFPCSLMMAFTAQVVDGAGTEVVVDGEELTDARFFTREELRAGVVDGAVALPMRASIARALIESWYGGPLPA